MKVKELIAHLQQFDPELDVVAYGALEYYDVLTPHGIFLEDGEYYYGKKASQQRVGPHIEIIGGYHDRD